MTAETETSTFTIRSFPRPGPRHKYPELPLFGDELWTRIVGGTGVHQCSEVPDSVVGFFCEDCLIRWPCVYARYAYMEPRLESLAEALRAKEYPLLLVANVVSAKSDAFPFPDLRPDKTDYIPRGHARRHEYPPMPWTIPEHPDTITG